jgi:hypothetical protein
MLVMGRGDNDGIDLARADQFPAVIENLQATLLVRGQFVRGPGGNRFEFAPFDFAGQKVIRMMAPDVAHADDTESN